MAINEGEVTNKGAKKMLRVQVSEGDKTKVNICVPLSLAKVALKFIPKDASMKLKDSEVDINELLTLIDHEDLKDLTVDVQDGESIVKVFVE